MLTAKLTSKGQITIPKKVRDKIGVSPGDEVKFEEGNGIFYIKKRVRNSPFDRWTGFIQKHNQKDSDTIIEDLRGK